LLRIRVKLLRGKGKNEERKIQWKIFNEGLMEIYEMMRGRRRRVRP